MIMKKLPWPIIKPTKKIWKRDLEHHMLLYIWQMKQDVTGKMKQDVSQIKQTIKKLIWKRNSRCSSQKKKIILRCRTWASFYIDDDQEDIDDLTWNQTHIW